MYERLETEYFTAKRKAAKRLGRACKPADLPSNAEIREQIQVFALRIHEGEQAALATAKCVSMPARSCGCPLSVPV